MTWHRFDPPYLGMDFWGSRCQTTGCGLKENAPVHQKPVRGKKVGPLVDEPCRCPGPCQACKEGMHHRECVNKGTNAGESVPGLDFLLSAKKEPKA